MIRIRAGSQHYERGCNSCGIVLSIGFIHTVISFATDTRARNTICLCEDCSKSLHAHLHYHMKTEPFGAKPTRRFGNLARIVRKTLKRK